MFSVVTFHCSIDCFIRRTSVGNGIEFRWLAGAARPAPVNHVAVVAAIGVKCQRVVGQEAPPLSVSRRDPSAAIARYTSRVESILTGQA